jgi:cytochrome P450
VLGGQALSQHDRLWLLWASANLDESEFPDAERLVLDRSPNRHVAFGVGIHRCIGSGAARAMWQIIVAEVLRRLPDYAVDEEHAEQYVNTAVVNGWIHLPVTFTPTPRVGITIDGLEGGSTP